MNKQELESKIEKLEKGIASKVTPENLKASLKSQKEKFEKELAELLKKDKKAVSDKIKSLKDKVKSKVSSISRDGARKAKASGKRVAADGSIYYEKRANRTDSQTEKKPYLEKGGELEGLTANIYRSDYDSPTNKMYGKKSVTIIDKDVPKIFEPSESAPAVKLVRRKLGFGSKEYEYVHAIPYDQAEQRGMFGGTFIYSSDSRFPSKNPIPLHDRVESYKDGGKIEEIDMEMVESSAKFYTDESKWTTKPTIKKFEDEIEEMELLKNKLDNKQITPSKIIGTGFKAQYARPLAYRWLNERILVAKKAIEILKERGQTMAEGGKLSNEEYDKLTREYDKLAALAEDAVDEEKEEYKIELEKVAQKIHRAERGYDKGGVIYEVGIDEGDKYGTRTLADFEREKDAKDFMYDYSLKHPRAKLFIDTVTSDYMAKGGTVKYYDKDNEYKIGRPTNYIEKDILSRVNHNEEEFVGSFGWKTSMGKVADGYLYNLNDFDKNLVKDIKLKQGEKIFRYLNRTTAIGGMRPFIKINVDKALLYFLVNLEDDGIEFETKGVQANYIALIADKMAKGGGIYASDSLYYLQILKNGQEVAREKFRARSLKEAKEISEMEYEDDMIEKFGDNLSFIVSEAMEEGGYMAKGGESINGKEYIKKHIDDVKVGDTILSSDGHERTLSAENIKRDRFMGTTIFGDSYSLGHKPVLVRKHEQGGYMAAGGKIYSISKNGNPYDWGLYTKEEAQKVIDKEEKDGSFYSIIKYNDMRDSLPAIERMNTPTLDEIKGKFNFNDSKPFSQGDLYEYKQGGYMAKGGNVKVGGKVMYGGKEAKVLNKKGDMYFIEVENYYANGDTLRTVIRESEVDKMEDGGKTDEYSNARLMGRESINWDMEGREYYGNSWDTLTKNEKDEIISDMKKSFDRGSYFADGGTTEDQNLDVFGYQTKHFDMCKIAQDEFEKAMIIIAENGKDATKLALSREAMYVDDVLGTEKKAKEDKMIGKAQFEFAVTQALIASSYNYASGLEVNLFSFLPMHLTEIAKRLVDNTKEANVEISAYDVLVLRDEVGEKAFKAMTPEERVEAAKTHKAKFEEGGELHGNYEMVMSQAKAIKHHAEELSEVLKKDVPVEAWVVGKIERASTDISDVTHYLDGLKFEDGGEIENQYEERTPSDIWDSYTKMQKQHFAYDHLDEIEERKDGKSFKTTDIKAAYNSNWADLDKDVQKSFENHVREGQYEKGGKLDKGVYYIGKPKKEGKIWAQEIVEFDENGLSFATDYARKLSDFKSKDYKAISHDELESFIKHNPDASKMSAGGMVTGRWYRDNQGVEHRYIGIDSKGNPLFKNGDKVQAKSFEDFEEKPKEKKLFGLFEEGGELKEEFLEDMAELHKEIAEITLVDGSKISGEELRQAHRKMADGGETDNWERTRTRKIKTKEEAEKALPLFAKNMGKAGRNYEIEEKEDGYVITYDRNFSNKMASGGFTSSFSGTPDRRRVTKAKGGEISKESVLGLKDWNKFDNDFNTTYQYKDNTISPIFYDKYTKKYDLSSKRGHGKQYQTLKEAKLAAYDEAKFGKMAMGGKVKFEDKVKAIKASLLKKKKVSPKVQKDYGKTYSTKEAEQAAKRIAGSMRKKEMK